MTAPTTIEAPVTEVTLMEDRAHAVRQARVELPAGSSRLRVTGVTPILADRTLCGAIRPAGGRPNRPRSLSRRGGVL